MAGFGRHKNFGRNAAVKTRTYRGPDRRDSEAESPVEMERTVRHDAKGNPVLEVRTTSQRRRKDDDTLDLLKALDADELKLT